MLCLPSAAIAQRLSCNLQAGLACSQVLGDPFKGNNRLGPSLGFGLHQGFTPRWGWRAELAYNTKGAIRKDQPLVEYRKLPYLNVRVLGQLDLTGRLSVTAGVAPGLLLRYY